MLTCTIGLPVRYELRGKELVQVPWTQPAKAAKGDARVMALAVEAVAKQRSALVFCESRNQCQRCAKDLAAALPEPEHTVVEVTLALAKPLGFGFQHRSVTTPQAARGWSHPPCRHFKNQSC